VTGLPAASSEVPSTAGALSSQYRTVTVAMVALVSLVAFEALAVSTAMPVVAERLHGLRSYGLAFSLFLTMSMLGTVVAGGWSDSRGPRWPIVWGLLLFAGGLVVSGTAQTFPAMLVGRVVSGVGGGFLIVSLYVVIALVYPDALRPQVFGWISAAWVVPSLVGPAVSGWLVTAVSWRLVFLGVPPFVLLVALGLLPRVWGMVNSSPEGADGVRASKRWAASGVGLAAGAAALQWGAQELDPPSGWSLAALAGGAGAVALCLPRLLPPGTLKAAIGLPAVIAVRGLIGACFFGAETFVPLMLVNERGLSPGVAGLTLTGGAIGWTAGAWLQGRPGAVATRYRFLYAGGVLVTLSVAVLPIAVLGGVSALVVLPIWLVGGFGMGMALSTTSVLVLSYSLPGQEGRNSASLQVSDALGSVVGIGAAGAVFAALHTAPGDDGHIFPLIWLGLAVVGVAATLVGRRGRPVDAGSVASDSPANLLAP
jgi:MFS family permease